MQNIKVTCKEKYSLKKIYTIISQNIVAFPSENVNRYVCISILEENYEHKVKNEQSEIK